MLPGNDLLRDTALVLAEAALSAAGFPLDDAEALKAIAIKVRAADLRMQFQGEERQPGRRPYPPELLAVVVACERVERSRSISISEARRRVARRLGVTPGLVATAREKLRRALKAADPLANPELLEMRRERLIKHAMARLSSAAEAKAEHVRSRQGRRASTY